MRARPGLARAVDWRVYFVTDTVLSGGPTRVGDIVEQAICGGVGVVQVRDKELPDDDFIGLTRSCMAAVERAFDATGRRAELVVNDRLAIAEQFGLGFHQGQSDGSITAARARLGDAVLIGLSISNRIQLEAELADPVADVLGLSPLWSTPTKTDTDPALGLDGTRSLVDLTAGRAVTLAIGGINSTNATEAIGTGVDGICVVSAIATSPDPRSTAAHLLSLWS